MKPLSECKVLVTPTSYGKDDPSLRLDLEQAVGEVVYNPLGRPLKSAELLPMVRDCDGFIAGLDEIDAAVIEAAEHLQVIARYGVGVDRVDLKVATLRGVVVANTPGANSVAVAELTIGLILALGRNLCKGNEATHSGAWPCLSGVGLRGKTVGLVGFGRIGREVASRLASFGCRVLAYDPYLTTNELQPYGVEWAALDDLLARSDFVSLHAPSTPDTVGMVNADFLGIMKPGAFLVNTARGELVNEVALTSALKSGRLRGAALDCFYQEPLAPDNPLLQCEQAILTPHTGSHTDEATYQMGSMALQACLAVLRGERPAHVVNPAVYDEAD